MFTHRATRWVACSVVAVVWSLVAGSPARAWVWPVDGEVLRGYAVGGDKYAAGQHRGIDIAVGEGASIRAPAAGEVSFAGQVPTYGLTVTIVTGDGYKASLTHLGTHARPQGRHRRRGRPDRGPRTVGRCRAPGFVRPSRHSGRRGRVRRPTRPAPAAECPQPSPGTRGAARPGSLTRSGARASAGCRAAGADFRLLRRRHRPRPSRRSRHRTRPRLRPNQRLSSRRQSWSPRACRRWFRPVLQRGSMPGRTWRPFLRAFPPRRAQRTSRRRRVQMLRPDVKPWTRATASANASASRSYVRARARTADLIVVDRPAAHVTRVPDLTRRHPGGFAEPGDAAAGISIRSASARHAAGLGRRACSSSSSAGRSWPGAGVSESHSLSLAPVIQAEKPRKILVAVAWPYANGLRHIGHVAGFGVPSDTFARYHRFRGNDVLMVSGTDEHGTPVMVAADAAGESPRETADRFSEFIRKDLRDLGLSYDLFTRTTRGTTTTSRTISSERFTRRATSSSARHSVRSPPRRAIRFRIGTSRVHARSAASRKPAAISATTVATSSIRPT